MTIAQYLPQWLQSRLRKPASQKAKAASKKEWQVLPMVPKPPCPPRPLDEDGAPLRFRIHWRM
jgi:hypothetical protein